MRAHDVDARAIVRTAVVIALTVAGAVAAVLLMLHQGRIAPSGELVGAQSGPQVDGTTLQSAPQPDLARYRDEKRRLLDSAAWIDKGRGIARIPISDAMDIMSGARQ
jgi:hypothetical protein